MFEPVFLLPLPPMDYMSIVALGLKAAGVKLVEVGGWGRHVDYTDRAVLARARRALEGCGVQVYSYHPPFGGRYDFSVLHEGRRAEAVQLNIQHLEVAAALGAEYAVIHPSGYVPPAEHVFSRRNALRGLRELARRAERIGVKLAIENMVPSYVAADIDELMLLVHACESEAAGVCFDTGHAHHVGWRMGDAISRIGSKLFTIHWHDNDGSADQHKLPGQGTIDWTEFFSALEALGWSRPICLEARAPDHVPYDQFVALVQQALAQRRPLDLPG